MIKVKFILQGVTYLEGEYNSYIPAIEGNKIFLFDEIKKIPEQEFMVKDVIEKYGRSQAFIEVHVEKI